MAGKRRLPASTAETAEGRRIEAMRLDPAWRRWGPYVSDRQWGTVREDYSPGGTAWDHFPHDHARSRAYRWGEDGIAGFSDDRQLWCLGVALWNGQDPILKERLFGLTNSEGNHGEDVKEYYYYLDSTPTHSYMKLLYKYPQRAFPYTELVETNRQRGKHEPEYELFDTGIFAEDRYFDVVVEYAKAGHGDILIRISATNRGRDAAELHLLPTIWFRNTWSWGYEDERRIRPTLRRADPTGDGHGSLINVEHHSLGRYILACEELETGDWGLGASEEQGAGLLAPSLKSLAPTLLFTENETNLQRLYDVPNPSPY